VLKTTIIVPCHNEARRLHAIKFLQFIRLQPDVQFLFVNDGSTDGTLDLLHQLNEVSPEHFEILNLEHNCGKAEAVRRGMLQGAATSPAYIGFWDADLATPLDAIPEFIRVLDRRHEVNLLLGVRLPLLGHAIQRQPARRLLGKCFARVASYLLGIRCSDTQCGAKMFRFSPELLSLFSQPFDSRWIFDVELLARLIRLRRGTLLPRVSENVFEIPLEKWEDVAGSKLKRGDFFKAVSELGRIWWRYLRPAATPYVPASTTLTPDSVTQAAPRRAA
jgi:dolichyl-phosphate beta-glucosyltransferase